MTQAQVCLKLRATQVQIAILQTHIFARQSIHRSRLNLKRRRASIVQDKNLSRSYFYLARSNLRIALPLCAQHDFACDSNHILAAHILSLRVSRRRGLFVKDNLRDSIAVAQVNKGQRAEVTPARNPAHQGYSLSNTLSTQRAA